MKTRVRHYHVLFSGISHLLICYVGSEVMAESIISKPRYVINTGIYFRQRSLGLMQPRSASLRRDDLNVALRD